MQRQTFYLCLCFEPYQPVFKWTLFVAPAARVSASGLSVSPEFSQRVHYVTRLPQPTPSLLPVLQKSFDAAALTSWCSACRST